VQEVAAYLTGILETIPAQNAAGEIYQVRMTTCEITNEDSLDRGIWLYQEQALVSNLGQPYRQRFLHLIPTGDGAGVQSVSFRPVDDQSWIKFCAQTREERNVTMAAMVDQQCTVTLTPLYTIYRGDTPAQGCPAKIRGAVTITNTIVLHKRGMDTWDRGYDSEGKQLWGAENKPYRFIRTTAIAQ
jgi:hypothetical protein